MLNKSNHILKDDRVGVFDLLFKFAAVVGVVAGLYFYSVNPFFFGFVGLFSFALLAFNMGDSEMIAYEDRVEVIGRSFFYLLKTKKLISYREVKCIYFQEGKYNWFNLIFNAPSANQEKGIKIVLKEKNSPDVIFSSSESKDAMALVGFIKGRLEE